MKIRHLVQKTFETTALYTSIRSVEPRLLKNSFLVVLDQEKFAGILTSDAVVAASHQVVIDCLHKIPQVDCEEQIESALQLMKDTGNFVLPVFESANFIGVVTRTVITDYLLGEIQKLNQELEQRVAERTEALRVSEKSFQAIVAKGADGILIMDQEGQLQYINPAAETLLGRKAEELLGETLGFPLVSGAYIEVDVIRKDGKPGLAEMRAVETIWKDKLAYLASLRDITDRKESEEKLRHAHKELEAHLEQLKKTHEENTQLLEAIPSILISIDQKNRVSQWSTSAEKVFAIKQDDIVGKTLQDSNIQWHWDTITANIEACRSDKHRIRADDVRFTRLDGFEGFLGLTFNPIVRDRQGTLDVLILGSDITERKIMEEHLNQSQKLESIGQLASGIAHEINTPIQYVGDNTQFLKKSFVNINILLEKYQQLLEEVERESFCPELTAQVREAIVTTKVEYLTEEIPEAIQEALGGIDRVASIVRAMKEFAHPGKKEKTAIDINTAIESTITIARNEWKYVADMKTNFDPDLELVPCLPGEFNQVILNMIVNAAHAIADVVGDGSDKKGTITISTNMNGDWAEIRIGDTGSGIPEEIQPRIFDPFFTTKEVGTGSGQGLAIAHNVIVEKHGGTITCKTEVGKGTTFLIRLPCNPAPVSQELESANA